MDDLGRPQGSYPGSFMSLSLFLAEIYAFVFFSSKNVTDRDSDRHTLLNFNIDVVRMKSYKYCILSQLASIYNCYTGLACKFSDSPCD